MGIEKEGAGKEGYDHRGRKEDTNCPFPGEDSQNLAKRG